MTTLGNLDIGAANAGGSAEEGAPKSPLTETERARLERSLGHRPDRHELEERNILKPGNLAPALQAKRDELQKSQLADRLEGVWNEGPKRTTLSTGDLEGSECRSGTAGQARGTAKVQLTDKLEGRLERRPEKDDLVNRGILKDQSVAPALQGKKEELERARLGNSLQKELEHRPDPEELRQKGILPQDA
ncbi:hypothetical protein L1887_55052 [Cichorium endivia]|nr:hypothetical protein L1887_55052 [Cichorium endivia]